MWFRTPQQNEPGARCSIRIANLPLLGCSQDSSDGSSGNPQLGSSSPAPTPGPPAPSSLPASGCGSCPIKRPLHDCRIQEGRNERISTWSQRRVSSLPERLGSCGLLSTGAGRRAEGPCVLPGVERSASLCWSHLNRSCSQSLPPPDSSRPQTFPRSSGPLVPYVLILAPYPVHLSSFSQLAEGWLGLFLFFSRTTWLLALVPVPRITPFSGSPGPQVSVFSGLGSWLIWIYNVCACRRTVLSARASVKETKSQKRKAVTPVE